MTKDNAGDHRPDATVTVSRRVLLAGLVSTCATGAFGKSVDSGSRRIVDVHAHYYPPALKALNEPTPMNSWSLDQHIESMDAAGVVRSMLSLTTPGIVATGERGRALARESNEYAAKLSSGHPGRFGFFATIQPDDV